VSDHAFFNLRIQSPQSASDFLANLIDFGKVMPWSDASLFSVKSSFLQSPQQSSLS